MIRCTTDFHPIGQGLFINGLLENYNSEECFSYVFDCGSISKRIHLDRQIASYLSNLNGKMIDLFHISHFDSDHINGALTLLKHAGAKTIVLPYASLSDRLLLALRQNAAGDYFDFLVDPAATLLAASPETSRILFVQGGGNEVPPEDQRGSQGDSDDSLDPRFPHGSGFEPLEDGNAPDSSRVYIIKHHQAISLGGCYEFVYYNAAQPVQATQSLRHRLAKLLVRFKNEDGTYRSELLLPLLKHLYGDIYGESGRERNEISLIVYAGGTRYIDIGFKHSLNRVDYKPLNMSSTKRNHLAIWSKFPLAWISYPADTRQFPTSSFLLTGDALFDTAPKIGMIMRHLGSRWHRIVALQVPHHGSKHSWFPGAAQLIPMDFAIVSAGRNRKCHPTREVMTDLQNTVSSVCHVHEKRGLILWGFI